MTHEAGSEPGAQCDEACSTGAAGSPFELPRHTTPTWEVELLISGVAVFAMLQLPGLLDDAMFSLSARLGAQWRQPLMLLYIYSKGAAVMLAGTFVLHLLLRARWIALVGLVSIYPRGVDWEKLRVGPITRAVERIRFGSTADVIERADNRATIVFAVGVTLAGLLIALSLFAVLLTALLGAGGLGGNSIGMVLFALVLPFVLAQLIDRRLGHRIAPGSWTYRVIARCAAVYSGVGISSSGNAPLAILSSNAGQRRMAFFFPAVMVVVLALVLLSYRFLREPDSFGSFDLFPKAELGATHAINPAHYDDERNPTRGPLVPFVQGAVMLGPYLRLTVPYDPLRHAPEVTRRCPALARQHGAAREAMARECLARLYAVSLDGKAIAPDYEIGSDARTDRPALVAMIDVRGLSRGRHELQVAMVRNEGSGEERAAEAPAAFRIPFWR